MKRWIYFVLLILAFAFTVHEAFSQKTFPPYRIKGGGGISMDDTTHSDSVIIKPPQNLGHSYALETFDSLHTTLNYANRASACSKDGLHQYIAVAGGYVYGSSDGGLTWYVLGPPGNTAKSWRFIACDSAGANLIFGAYNGRLYTSADFGLTNTERRPMGADANQLWVDGDISADGTACGAVYDGGSVVYSQNGGATWSDINPVGLTSHGWQCFKLAQNDGRVIGVSFIETTYGKQFISKDYGATWDTVTINGVTTNKIDQWDFNRGGNKVIISRYNDSLYVSGDSGATWTRQSLAGTVKAQWECLRSDDDGSDFVVASSSGYLYSTRNSGSTWTIRHPEGGTATKNWKTVFISGDGLTQGAGIYPGKFYVTENAWTTGEEREPGAYQYPIINTSGKMRLTGTTTATATGGGSSGGTGRIYRYASFNLPSPSDYFAVDSQWCAIGLTADSLTVTSVHVVCDADPTTEINATLRYADNFKTLANAVTIRSLNTTAGELTSTSMSNAGVPAGKCIYVQFGASPDAATTQVIIDLVFYFGE